MRAEPLTLDGIRRACGLEAWAGGSGYSRATAIGVAEPRGGILRR